MARTTANYNITVPELNDAPDVSVLSGAIDDLDAAVAGALTDSEERVGEMLSGAIGSLGEGVTVAGALSSMQSALSAALGDLGSQSVEQALDAMADSVPGLVESAIGDEVETQVSAYLANQGISVSVEDVTGAISGISVNGGAAVTASGSSHVVNLSGLVTSINSTAPVNGNVTIDTGAGAVKAVYSEVTPASGDNPSASGWYELTGGAYTATSDTAAASGKTYYTKTSPDANGNITLDTGSGTVKTVNGVSPDAAGALTISAAHLSGSVMAVTVGNVAYYPDSEYHRVGLPVVTSVNGQSATAQNGAITINTGVVQLLFSATISSSTVTLLDSGTGYYHYSVPVAAVTVSGTQYNLAAGDVAVLAPNESGHTSIAAVEAFREIFADIWGAETGANVLKFYLPYAAPNTNLPVLLKVVRSV